MLLSTVLIWRSLNTGFVLDADGLTMRSFMPGADRLIPWDKLMSVNVDVVVVGVGDGRTSKLRVSFVVDGGGDFPQLVGCPKSIAKDVLARFEARSLPATDKRDVA